MRSEPYLCILESDKEQREIWDEKLAWGRMTAHANGPCTFAVKFYLNGCVCSRSFSLPYTHTHSTMHIVRVKWRWGRRWGDCSGWGSFYLLSEAGAAQLCPKSGDSMSQLCSLGSYHCPNLVLQHPFDLKRSPNFLPKISYFCLS